MLVTLEVFHEDTSLLKELAFQNIPYMSRTFEVSHEDIFWLNELDPLNI